MSIKTYFNVLILVILFFSSLAADIDESDVGSENIEQPAANTPFNLEVSLDVIGEAEINKGFFKKDQLRFSEAEGELSLIFYYCPAYTEGASLALSYTYTAIRWNENPWFNQDHFNTLTIGLGGFTKRLYRWLWQSQIAINIDADAWDLNDYATYDFLLWGRYEYCTHIGVHIGLIAQTGMQMDRVFPILGADWQMSRRWKLNLVFPVNVSLEYLLNREWSVALAGRSFNTRQRINRHDSSPEALVRYENVGAEFAINYKAPAMTINVHAGSTLGGTFRVANRHNHHSHRYHLDPSGYAGAEVNVKF